MNVDESEMKRFQINWRVPKQIRIKELQGKVIYTGNDGVAWVSAVAPMDRLANICIFCKKNFNATPNLWFEKWLDKQISEDRLIGVQQDSFMVI